MTLFKKLVVNGGEPTTQDIIATLIEIENRLSKLEAGGVKKVVKKRLSRAQKGETISWQSFIDKLVPLRVGEIVDMSEFVAEKKIPAKNFANRLSVWSAAYRKENGITNAYKVIDAGKMVFVKRTK